MALFSQRTEEVLIDYSIERDKHFYLIHPLATFFDSTEDSAFQVPKNAMLYTFPAANCIGILILRYQALTLIKTWLMKRSPYKFMQLDNYQHILTWFSLLPSILTLLGGLGFQEAPGWPLPCLLVALHRSLSHSVHGVVNSSLRTIREKSTAV